MTKSVMPTLSHRELLAASVLAPLGIVRQRGAPAAPTVRSSRSATCRGVRSIALQRHFRLSPRSIIRM
jgi:hypothetical protein